MTGAINTEWPKKSIHSLLINIFAINLNEISISGWECNWIQNSRTSLLSILLLYKYSIYGYRVTFFMSKCVYIFMGHSVYIVAAVLWLQFVWHVMLLPMLNVLRFTSLLSAVCVCVCVRFPVWLFSVVPWCSAFPVFCSGIVWMILRRLQLRLWLLSCNIPRALHLCRNVFIF